MPLAARIPHTVYAMRYLWDRVRDEVITGREALIMLIQCKKLLTTPKIVNGFAFAIHVGNMTQADFLDGYESLPLDQVQLAAIYYALTQ